MDEVEPYPVRYRPFVCPGGTFVLSSQAVSNRLPGRVYPRADIQMDALEEELLKYSNGIRLEDDLTFIEIRFNNF
jgi:hypothetical protein